MPRPKKKRDRDAKAIKQAVISGEIQTDPIEDYYLDPYGRPIVQMLTEAPVEVLGNRDRDLAADALNVLGVAAREGVGLLPLAGEALDAAEVAHAAKYGTDYYGGEASPELLGGLTAAGYLVPNIIERPLKAFGRVFKGGHRALKNKPSFDLEGLAPNEAPTFKKIAEEDFVGQAKIDMSLHDLAQSNDVWTDSQKKFLEDDKALKQRFIKLIEDGGGSQEEIQSVIDGITKDKDIHARYINEYLVEDPGLASQAGGNAWHKNWIKVYDGWLAELERMSSSYAKGGIMKAVKRSAKSGKIKPKKRDYKKEYKKFQSSGKMKKYRAKLNKYNRKKGTYGNGDRLDASHKGRKIVKFESQSKNRGRKEKSRLKKK